MWVNVTQWGEALQGCSHFGAKDTELIYTVGPFTDFVQMYL